MKYMWCPKTGEEFLLESDDPAKGLVDSPALCHVKKTKTVNAEEVKEATEFSSMKKAELKAYLDKKSIAHKMWWNKEKLITACIEG